LAIISAGGKRSRFTLFGLPLVDTRKAGGFAAAVAKLAASLGVFLPPIFTEKFGVPSVLGIIGGKSAGVSSLR